MAFSVLGNGRCRCEKLCVAQAAAPLRKEYGQALCMRCLSRIPVSRAVCGVNVAVQIYGCYSMGCTVRMAFGRGLLA